MTTITIPPRGGMDMDEHQEYVCLLLEGVEPARARQLARSANDKVNSRRLSGPQSGDLRNGRGVRPLVSDLSAEATSGVYQDARPITLDTRTDEERETDWSRIDRAHRYWEMMAPRQRLLVGEYLGLVTGEPLTRYQVAEKHGVSASYVAKTLARGAERVRRVTQVTQLGVDK